MKVELQQVIDALGQRPRPRPRDFDGTGSVALYESGRRQAKLLGVVSGDVWLAALESLSSVRRLPGFSIDASGVVLDSVGAGEAQALERLVRRRERLTAQLAAVTAKIDGSDAVDAELAALE